MISILAWNSIDLDIKNSYKLFPRLIKLNWISLLFIVWTRNGGIIITREAIYSYHFLSCILSRNLQLFVAQYVGIYHVDLHLPSNNHRINPSLLRHSFWHYLRTKHALFHHYKSSTSLLHVPRVWTSASLFKTNVQALLTVQVDFPFRHVHLKKSLRIFPLHNITSLKYITHIYIYTYLILRKSRCINRWDRKKIFTHPGQNK